MTVEFLDAPIEDNDEVNNNDDDEQLNSGQVITFTRDVIRQAVMKSNPRLIEAMYLAVITTTSEALNGTYAVLGRRRSDILSESIREGTGVFIIHAYLPVATSFGFADELGNSLRVLPALSSCFRTGKSWISIRTKSSARMEKS